MVFIPEEHYLWDFWLVSPQEWGDVREPYHLYYLQAPRTLNDPIMRHNIATVGHAISDDLRHWEHHGTVLEAGQPGSWDDMTIWTGCVTIRDGRAYMFYTGRSHADRGLVQRIGLAISNDLVNWNRHPGNPLIEVAHAHGLLFRIDAHKLCANVM